MPGMAVLNALRQTPGALQRNPVLFVPVLVIVLFQVPQLLLQAVNPLIASVVSAGLSLVFVFVLPLFQGGIIGMADEALDGRTSLDRFLTDAKANYVSLLVAYLVVLAVNFVLGIVTFFVAVVGGVAVFTDAAGGVGLGVLVGLGVVVAALGLAYLLFVFFIQFYGQAIVLNDLDAIEGIKHSVAVVRRNLLSALGYSVLVGVLGGLAGLVFGGASMLLSPRSTGVVSVPEVSVAGAIAVMLLVVGLGSLFGVFFGLYSVAFYRAIDPESPDGS